MKISAATGMYQRRGDSPLHRDLNEVITVLKQVGFDTFDLSFSSVSQPEFILKGDDWEKKIDRLGNTAARLGVSFFQSHLPFVDLCSIQMCPDFRDAGYVKRFWEYTRRAYIANRMLGIGWTVMHPVTCPEHNYENKATFETNHALYDPYIEEGIRLGVGTAIENMPPNRTRQLASVYCQHYDQLIELVDSFGDSLVGICWDTGHAHQAQLDQERALRVMGRRVKVLHISDNHTSGWDEHLLPYIGDIDWDSVLRGLVDIGYDGTLNFEAGNTSARAHGWLQLEYMKLAYQNGRYLLERYETMKREKGCRQGEWRQTADKDYHHGHSGCGDMEDNSL